MQLDSSQTWLQQRDVLQQRYATLSDRAPRDKEGESASTSTDYYTIPHAKEAEHLEQLVTRGRRFPESAHQLRSEIVERQLTILAQEEQMLGDVQRDAMLLIASLEAAEFTPAEFSRDCGGGTGTIPSARQCSSSIVPSSQLRRFADPTTSKSQTSHGPSDVSQRHATFLAGNGGPTLGWTPDDHDAFLRVFLRGSPPSTAASAHDKGGDNAAVVLGDLVRALPHRPAHDLSQHLSLYLTHMSFLEEKRLAVLAYREQRRSEEHHLLEERHVVQAQREAAAMMQATTQERRRRAHHDMIRQQVTAWKAGKENANELRAAHPTSIAAPLLRSTRVPLRGVAHTATHQHKKVPVVTGPILAPSTATPEQQRRDLQKRWEADMVRTEQRRGKSELARLHAATTRADVIEGLRATPNRSASASSPPSKERHLQLTASAAARQAHTNPAVIGSDVGRGGASILRGDSGTYLTPRYAPVGAHLMTASWCDKGYLR